MQKLPIKMPTLMELIILQAVVHIVLVEGSGNCWIGLAKNYNVFGCLSESYCLPMHAANIVLVNVK